MSRFSARWLVVAIALGLGPVPWTAAASDQALAGRVLETMDAGPYTYVRIATNEGEVWVAGPRFEVDEGDRVVAQDVFTMRDFHSKTLDRTFQRIDFASRIALEGSTEAEAAPHPPSPHTQTKADAGEPPPKVERAKGGKTIAELYAERTSLVDQPVSVRGRVVKYTPNILGRNWIHIQDGSGDAEGQDLTVTTTGEAKVGDIITANGVLHTDRDFGAGYRYEVIVEDAEITVE